MHQTSSSIDSVPLDASHRLALAAELAGEFDVERRIRKDPWSAVYLARDLEHGRPVAIRVLHATVDADQRGHVDRTARMLARLQHPNIVGLHEARWLRDGRLALMLQWIDGECLRDVLDDSPLSRECMVEVLHDVARALQVAQSRARALGIAPGLVHHAIAPEHVLLALETGSALLDPSLTLFGLADSESGCLAPELHTLRPPTPRTDVYTLAVLGWEMLTGASPCVEPAPRDTPLGGPEATLWRGMQQKVVWRWSSVESFLSALQPVSLVPGTTPDPGEDDLEPTAASAPHAPGEVDAPPETTWEDVELAEAARAEAERADVEQDAIEQERRARDELEREEAERARDESAQAVLARWNEQAASGASPDDETPGQGPVPDGGPAGAGILRHARAHRALVPALVVSALSIAAVGVLLLRGPSTRSATPRSAAATRAPRSDKRITVAAMGGEPVFGAVPRTTAPRPAAPSAPHGVGALRDLFVRVRGAVAREVPRVVASPAAARDSNVDVLPPNEPRPRVMWGEWHHGDGSRAYARPKYSDVLTLRLNPDGSALLDERRYTLQRSGAWTVAAVAHQGTWDVRSAVLSESVLCVRWRTPRVATACEPVTIGHDTTPLGPLLTFAGRHWRAGPPPADQPDRPSTRRRGRARASAQR